MKSIRKTKQTEVILLPSTNIKLRRQIVNLDIRIASKKFQTIPIGEELPKLSLLE
jgi:hypothetical protein